MACNAPLTAYRKRGGDGPPTFQDKSNNGGYEELKLPCGKCMGCRIAKQKEWTFRCMNEAQLHQENSYITLTYSDENLPHDHGLNHRDFQLFMKRLRKNTGKKIRFFMCGEYGTQTNRPHYHAILFGIAFDDKRLVKATKKGNLYRSQTLDKAWKLGHAWIGAVVPKTIKYVCGYVLKKQMGKVKEREHIDPDTGQIHVVSSEYARMSNRPGIGKEWFDKFHLDIYPGSTVHDADGKKYRSPKYYDKKLEEIRPELWSFEKLLREIEAKKYFASVDDEKRAVRERNLRRKKIGLKGKV